MNFIKSQNGYTIIEGLVAIALISILILIFSKIISNLFQDVGPRDRLVAISLAQGTLEQCLTEKAFYDDIIQKKIDHREYWIKRKITKRNDEIRILIEIFNRSSPECIYSITMRTVHGY
jgi:prepilin-type N-terminal cleavage/methylation domain-containing protein